ncbi:MAG: hypothetical protein AAF752_13285, partial [Bacteroidota bacterium]
RVQTVDGTVYQGQTIAEDDDSLTLRLADGTEVRLSKSNIASQGEAGRFVRRDPNVSRLLFAPTGRPVPSGQVYLADYMLFFPFVGVGIGDALTLAGGISLLPGASSQLVYVAPKLTVFQRPNQSIAVGFIGATSTQDAFDDDFDYGGLLYAVSTFGSEERSVTAGVGFAFSESEIGNTPILYVGGDVQVADNVKLVTENYFAVTESSSPLVTGGVRFFGEKLATDLALVTSPAFISSGGGFPAFPWLSFVYNF